MRSRLSLLSTQSAQPLLRSHNLGSSQLLVSRKDTRSVSRYVWTWRETLPYLLISDRLHGDLQWEIFKEKTNGFHMNYLNYPRKNLYTGCPLNGVGTGIEGLEEIKENKKVLYHFAIFAIVNELLIIRNCRISTIYSLQCKRAMRYGHPAIEVARRVGSCLLLQVAMPTHERRVKAMAHKKT